MSNGKRVKYILTDETIPSLEKLYNKYSLMERANQRNYENGYETYQGKEKNRKKYQKEQRKIAIAMERYKDPRDEYLGGKKKRRKSRKSRRKTRKTKKSKRRKRRKTRRRRRKC